MKKVFIDTNIWVYLLLNTNTEPNKKHYIAQQLLEKELVESRVCTSVQAINELYWTLIKKYKIDESTIKEKTDSIIQIVDVFSLTVNIYNKSFLLREKYNISFWDSLMIGSAIENEADIFYSEDMAHEQIISNQLKIFNPFK